MKILITGASGFIGAYITAKLISLGHEVVCAVRDVERTRLKFPNCKVVYCNFNTDHNPAIWNERLAGIDILINAVGILQSKAGNNIHNIHVKGTIALFEGAKLAGIKKIIHISALGIDDEKFTPYSASKREADLYLQSFKEVDWVILKPSLVYASGSFGGTSLLRALSTLPVIPLVGDGMQKFQPVHMNDLTDSIVYFINKDKPTRKVINVAGLEQLTVKEILFNFRSWLGLKPTKAVQIPKPIIRLFCKIGDILNIAPLNSTSYHMMEHGNTASAEEFIRETEITPKSFEIALATEPLTVQSLWHARLYFLKPCICFILGVFWFMSGMISLAVAPEKAYNLMLSLNIKPSFINILLPLGCFVDMIFGLCLMLRYKVTQVGLLQLILIFVYTVTLTVLENTLWFDPLGALMKNIPILLITLVMIAIERDK